MAKFVVQFGYHEDRDTMLAVRPEHRDYLQRLADEGRLLIAGAFADERGGLLVYEAADADEVQRLIDEDPYSKGGVIAQSTIRQWNPVLGGWLA